MSKLGLHVHAWNNDIFNYCKNVGGAVHFVLDFNDGMINEVKAAQPKSLLMARLWVPHQPLDNPIKNAKDFTDLLLLYMDGCNLDGAGGYNEWDGDLQYGQGGPEGLENWRRYADFEAERSRILHREGFKSVVGGCSVGTPPEAWFSEFKPALQEGDFLHLHEYSAPRMWDHENWHCLKYRHVYSYLKEHNLSILPLIISESGIDGGVMGRPREGWRKFGLTPVQYMGNWDWYDGRLLEDPYVVGCCAFDCGPQPGMGWQSFKMDPEMLPLFAKRIKALGVSYWEPKEEQPMDNDLIRAIDVSEWGGEIKEERWRGAYEAGYRLAIVQAWGGGPVPGGKNAYCAQQLAAARKAGMMTAIYFHLPPDTTTQTHLLVQAVKEAAGEEYQHVKFVAVDIEDEQLRPLHPTDSRGRLANAISHIKDKPVVVYTSGRMWGKVMGNMGGFEQYPLWDAQYDKKAELDVGWVAYGGWRERAMKQFQGTTQVAGISVDLNIGHLGRLGLSPPAPEPAPEVLKQRIQELEALAAIKDEEIRKKTAAMIAARNTLDGSLDT